MSRQNSILYLFGVCYNKDELNNFLNHQKKDEYFEFCYLHLTPYITVIRCPWNLSATSYSLGRTNISWLFENDLDDIGPELHNIHRNAYETAYSDEIHKKVIDELKDYFVSVPSF